MPRFRISLIIVFLIAVIVIVTNCTTTDMIRPRDDATCQRPITLETLDSPSGNDCASVTYRLKLDASLPGRNDYSYSFLELDENQPLKTKSEVKGGTQQLQKILEALRTDEKKFVIVYVHGWRHDASIGDGDEQAFRRFLAYSRSFMNQREEYQQAKLVGVYVGWRGALMKEPDNLYAGRAVAIPGFWSRESKSIEHSHAVLKYLKQIEAALHLDRGNPDADKMLVYGHSMGGNILATALHDCLLGVPGVECGDGPNRIAPLRDHKAQQLMKAPLGDLTVLINPASRSENWTDLQMAMREMRGEPWAQGQSVKNDFKFKNPLFPRNQPPTYISLTSTTNFPPSECMGDCSNKYDNITLQVFSLAHLNTVTALGHAFPTETFPFGASHEIITNEAAGMATKFERALAYKSSVCVRATNSILDAREFVNGSRGWDTYYNDKTNPDKPRKTLFVSKSPDTEIAIQIRQMLRPSQKIIPSFEEPNTPFWNVRVSPNTIVQHGDYKNYPLWCTLNQLVLDDTTGIR